MFRRAEGGFVTITENGSTPLADYAVPEWAAGTTYEADDIVHTESTNAGEEIRYWRAVVDRASVAEDSTGEDSDSAGVLNNEYWGEVEIGTLYALTEWGLRRTVTEDSFQLLIEEDPRTTYGNGPTELTLNFADNWEGQPTQRALEKRNNRVYIELYPKGKGTGLEVIKGYFRTGESSKSGRAGERVSNVVTLSSDGNVTSEAQK